MARPGVWARAGAFQRRQTMPLFDGRDGECGACPLQGTAVLTARHPDANGNTVVYNGGICLAAYRPAWCAAPTWKGRKKGEWE
jgi:hypothetical protein